MSDQATDFLKQYQTWAQQSWDTWMQSLQAPSPHPFQPFQRTASSPADDLLGRALGGLKSYADWLQAAATSGIVGQGQGDWQQSLRQLFTGGSQPFAQAFAGIDNASAQGFAQQWQAWLQAVQPNGFGVPPHGFGDLPGMGDIPAFGYTRERQMQQQMLADAMREYAETSARYQSLILRANAQGFEQLQEKLSKHMEPGRQVESLKALYDLWVDAAEEAYAEIALSDEFREAYGAMVNAQMRVRKLQQEQLEALCRELGMPTRSEVSALGKRVQELRREMRATTTAPAANDEVSALRAELAALKRKLASRSEPATVATKKVVSAPMDVDATRVRKSASARRATTTAPVRGAPRKRK
ncbi:poly(R)-hydroxyalkanoic acid synthase subunit PhaE [Dyella subtropica]|uniref:poly(R)-hydroxyalkanoic acid synthase subunit PhaE n=1 Tax=Dyella subtropica TaxID=2992127 RepID=UPI0022530347|nr:poly(R)-hydroxyalkanoic acid synthase subunit PhaE [Dyella subtropica]